MVTNRPSHENSLPPALRLADDDEHNVGATIENEIIPDALPRTKLKKTNQKDWLSRWANSNTFAAFALVTIGVGAFLSTWFLLSPAVETTERNVLVSLVVANVIIATGFAGLVAWRFWNVWSDRRHQLAGSRLHMKLVRWFTLVAVVPAIIAFLFAFMVLRSSLDDVFSARIENYHQIARDTANGLVGYVSQETKAQMLDAAIDIRRSEIQNLGFARTPLNFRSYLEIQARARSFAAIYLLDGNKNLVTRIELEEGVFTLPTSAVFDWLDRDIPDEKFVQGEISFDRYRFEINNNDQLDMWRGITKIPDYDNGYLIIYKSIDPTLANQLKQVRFIAADWSEALQGRLRLERVFVLGYVILGVTIMFGAIWLALGAATQIVSPIGRLVTMAENVSSGDLSARVAVYDNDGEVGELARSMNKMTGQLQTQRADLIDTNRQFDQRRRFTETVLAGVSAGVLGLGSDGRVTIANRSAAVLLGIEANRITGTPIEKLVPEITAMIEEVRQNPDKSVGGQVEFLRNGKTQTFNVQIVSDVGDQEGNFVVTIDDITQLIVAQRNAAWGDVARRIAHEIKNPLTPIQLSAERLQRKYKDEVNSSPEVFEKCTDTIIRQVKDIGRMVDEFSSFARMPKPVIQIEDIRELTKSAIFPQRVTYPDIQFDVDLLDGPDIKPILVECDGRLIVQALTNLIKNAAESISARLSQNVAALENGTQSGANSDDENAGKIIVRFCFEPSREGARHCTIEIVDNGIGLPQEERHRLAEPYMTTREKGTGLGLAIVKKIAEEHGGDLAFDDDNSIGLTGARISLSLPLAQYNTEKATPNVSKMEFVEDKFNEPVTQKVSVQ